MSKTFCRDAVLTVTYVINWMFSFRTPIQKFQKTFLASHLQFDLSFRVFGCTIFTHIHANNRSKLDPKVTKCWLQVLWLLHKKGLLLVTILLFSKTPYLQKPSFQGEKMSEESPSGQHLDLSLSFCEFPTTTTNIAPPNPNRDSSKQWTYYLIWFYLSPKVGNSSQEKDTEKPKNKEVIIYSRRSKLKDKELHTWCT